jgi:hypothetical protein
MDDDDRNLESGWSITKSDRDVGGTSMDLIITPVRKKR